MGICYLDNNATTPMMDDVCRAVVEAMGPQFANPSSPHKPGKRSLGLIGHARESVAKLLNCDTREIIFTSGATESNNHAIHAALQLNPKRKRIVTTSVEHSSVRSVLKHLNQSKGIEIATLPVNQDGNLDLQQFEKSLSDDVALVSIMWANNETGVIFPIEEISKIVRAKKILFHVDAVQAIGKLDVNLLKIHLDFLTLSGHKFYAPKGIGILYASRELDLSPFIIGGTQERGKRGGTENLTGIVGVGKASELIARDWKCYAERIAALRNRLESELLKRIPHSFVNGVRANRICNTSNIAILGTVSEILIPLLDEKDIYVSSGAACLTGAVEPSHVLLAMGLTREQALSSLRFSLGWNTTEKEIDYAIDIIPDVVRGVRQTECSIP